MNISAIKDELNNFRMDGKSMFVTSSFQTQSIVLLHIISRIDRAIPVYFINTGYHFPETITHKNNVASFLGLKVTDLVPLVPKNNQRDARGNLLFTFDPDYCCYINKVQPVEPLLEQYDVWINGIRANQNNFRSNLQVFESTGCRAVKFHPLLDWAIDDMEAYIREYNLPVHPLEKKGYKSVGCEPCTRPLKSSENREGRWFGMRKTECGLNTEWNNTKQ